MKKFLSLSFVSLLFLVGCSQSVEYNKNLEPGQVNTSISANIPLQKTYIYMEPSALGKQDIKSSTSLGKDNLSINIGEFVKEETQTFLKYYLTNLEFTTNKEILNSNNLIVMPEIKGFGFGFYSYDGFDIDAKPFVSYTLNLKMFKNGKQIYSNIISKQERRSGETTFFGMGVTSYAQIGPIFQKALTQDYNTHAAEIINAINSAR